MRGCFVPATRRFLGLCLIALLAAPFWAHGIVGDRMFIEPLVTGDANVKNELDLPGAEFLVQPDGTWRAIGFSFEKALYPHRFSFTLGIPGFTSVRTAEVWPAGTISTWG